MKNRNAIAISGMLLVVLGGGCNNDAPMEDTQLLSVKASDKLADTIRQPQFDVELNKGNTLVYRETGGGFGIFQMENGESYVLLINSAVAGATYRISVDNGAPFAIQAGPNPIPSATFPMPAVGNHSFRIESEIDGVTVSRSYSVGIACGASASASMLLNPNAIVVAPVSTNVYNFSASGIASGGIGPFQCAWDFNGDGVRDSAFVSCVTPVRAYSNHVDLRKIQVFVRDNTCNKVLLAEAERELLAPPHAAVLGMKPNLYVTGTISSSAPGLAGEKQVTLRHLSTNPPNITPAKVTCNYSRSAGKGTFTVQGLNRYGMSSSLQHGLTISIKDIDDTIVGGVSGGMSGANAKLNQVQFSTDESPDYLNRMLFQGGAPYCQLRSFQVEPKNVGGTPCSNLGSGVASDYVVAAEGTFDCTGLPATTATGASVNIQQGAFYCEYRLIDQCSGGGGGGGGVDPIRL